jgi:hypothetical protein
MLRHRSHQGRLRSSQDVTQIQLRTSHDVTQSRLRMHPLKHREGGRLGGAIMSLLQSPQMKPLDWL